MCHSQETKERDVSLRAFSTTILSPHRQETRESLWKTGRDVSRHEYESIRVQSVPSHANGSLGSEGASPWTRILTRPHSPSAATTLVNLHQSRARASSSSPGASRQDCVPPGLALNLCLTSQPYHSQREHGGRGSSAFLPKGSPGS
jgi:hypothetical protein